MRRFIAALPVMEVPTKYVVFKALSQTAAEEEPVAVVSFADPDQVSALVILENYQSEDNESVILPHAAGCQSIGVYTYREAKAKRQRAVVGHVGPSARVTLRRLGRELLTVSDPLALFRQMEADVPGSFLEKHTWKTLRQP